MLTENSPSLEKVQGDLSKHLEAANIQLAEAESFSEAPCDCVKKLKACIQGSGVLTQILENLHLCMVC